MKKYILPLSVAVGFAASTFAAVLIDMNFEDLSGTSIAAGTPVVNSGTAGNGSVWDSSGSRPLPGKVSGFNSSTALSFPDQQTGPTQKTAVTVNSGALDHATAFTVAFWFRGTDDANFPTLTTVFSTKGGDAAGSDAGVFVGMNRGGDGNPQPYLRVGDGTNGGETFFGAGGWGLWDGNWHFVAVTFDVNAADGNEFRMYSGDADNAVSSWGVYTGSNFDSVVSTGDAADVMYIGDGAGGFNAQGSFNGDLDNFYVADTALDLAGLEALRVAAIPEPSSVALLVMALGTLGWFRRRFH